EREQELRQRGSPLSDDDEIETRARRRSARRSLRCMGATAPGGGCERLEPNIQHKHPSVRADSKREPTSRSAACGDARLGPWLKTEQFRGRRVPRARRRDIRPGSRAASLQGVARFYKSASQQGSWLELRS